MTRDNISKLTIQLGVLTVLFGFGGFFGTGMQSYLSLIPLIFGVPLYFLGRLSRSEKRHKLWLRFAWFVGVLCALTTWAGFMDLIASVQADRLPSLSQFLRTTMFFGCSAYATLVFVYLWKIRKRRKKKNDQSILDV
jgi:apolipoprotein N-acyltransferase